MRKILFLILIFLSGSCSLGKLQKEHKDYAVQIYFFPIPNDNFEDGVLIYDNDDELYFSRKLIDGILTAKKKMFSIHEKDYLFEGFFKIYLIGEDERLEFEVIYSQDIFDVQKRCDLDYCAALDIYSYFGAKYLKEVMDNSSPDKSE